VIRFLETCPYAQVARLINMLARGGVEVEVTMPPAQQPPATAS
jgi:hypothetical protein